MAKRRGRRRPDSPRAAHHRSASDRRHASRSEGAGPPFGETVRFIKRFDVGWLLLACAVPVVLCLVRLDDDLWYDEIYTLSFAEQPLLDIATDYSAPNNHVLFSMLLRPFYMVSPHNASLRMPSLICSLGSLACVFYMGRAAGSVALGTAAVLALGLNPMFLVHTMQVRGYSLSMCLTAALGLLIVQGGARSWGRAAATAVLAAALVYTIPTNAIVAGCLGVAAIGARWYAARSWNAAAVELATWTAAALTAALLYWPIHDQVQAAQAGAVVGSWASTLRLAGRFYWAALHDFWILIPVVLIGLLVIARHMRLGKWNMADWSDVGSEKNSPNAISTAAMPWIIAMMLVMPFIATAALRVSPFVRVYSPLLPFVAVAVAWFVVCGIGGALTIGMRRLARPAPSTAAVSLFSMLVLLVPTVFFLPTYSARLTKVRQQHFAQDGYYNYYSANYHPSRVAAYLERTIPRNQPYLICFDDADMLNLRFYLAQLDVEVGHVMDTPDGETLARVFLVLPPLPRYDRITAQTGLTTETLKTLPETTNFGYYRVFASPGLLSLRLSTAGKPTDE